MTSSPQESLPVRRLLVAVVGVLSAIAALLGALLSMTASRVTVGASAALSLLLYILFLVLYPSLRFLFLGFMVGVDVGSFIYDVRILHAKVTVYPMFFLLTSSLGKVSLNVDVVQVIIVLEVVYFIVKRVGVRKASHSS